MDDFVSLIASIFINPKCTKLNIFTILEQLTLHYNLDDVTADILCQNAYQTILLVERRHAVSFGHSIILGFYFVYKIEVHVKAHKEYEA